MRAPISAWALLTLHAIQKLWIEIGQTKIFPVTISPPEGLESCVRGQNRGNWMLRVRKGCFWVISTLARGQKWLKTRFFRVFLNRKSQQKIQNGPNIKVFRIFWPLDGVKSTRKHRFWTRNVPKHRNRHPTRLSTPKDGRTLQKVWGPLLPKSVVHFYPGYLVRLG